MGSGPKTVELKVRVTEEQAAWLRARADERYGGKVSEALRSAVIDARLLEIARADCARLQGEQGFRFPLNAEPEPSTTVFEIVLAPPFGFEWTEVFE